LPENGEHSLVCSECYADLKNRRGCRNAGIIFLGDFWHSRGALPVELLNVAIMELQSWQCPAIFIPGNHDQVGITGLIIKKYELIPYGLYLF
jgi:metallophosphoesterase superfamily enzyme